MRTRAEWNTLIDPLIAPLGLSTSQFAEWKLFRDLSVTLAIVLEGIVNLFKADIDTALATKQPGGLSWYKGVCLEFQYGDSLVVDNGIVKYPVVNTTNRIVTQVSAKEILGDVMTIKVAKTDTITGGKVPLTASELVAFRDYLNARRFPGTKINIYSLAADKLYYDTSLFYQPGYDLTLLEAAIRARLDEFRDNTPFDAIVYVSDIVAAIESVPGVAGVSLTLDYIPASGSGFAVGAYVELQAGYFNWEPASFFDFIPAP